MTTSNSATAGPAILGQAAACETRAAPSTYGPSMNLIRPLAFWCLLICAVSFTLVQTFAITQRNNAVRVAPFWTAGFYYTAVSLLPTLIMLWWMTFRTVMVDYSCSRL